MVSGPVSYPVVELLTTTELSAESESSLDRFLLERRAVRKFQTYVFYGQNKFVANFTHHRRVPRVFCFVHRHREYCG